MKRRAVELHIERLVLHGVEPGNRAAFAAALEAEVSRLLGAPGALEALGPGRTVARLDGGTVPAPAAPRPAALGAAVARAAHRGMSS